MTQLRIRLFGTLSIESDGQPIASLPGQKCRDLLSYLVLRHDVRHPREQLAGLFWGERDDKHARHCFNTALWRLQVALGGTGGPAKRWLRVDSQTVSFCPDGVVVVDVLEFEAVCALAEGWPAGDGERRAALRRQAVALYQGELLTDCYDEWCLAERERLRRLYVRTLRRLVQHHRQSGEMDVAIDYARRILACDPLCEEMHRVVIRLYLEAGEPAAALQQYRICLELLRRELGVAPMPETSLLVQKLLRAGRQDGSPSSTAETDRAETATIRQSAGTELLLHVCRQLHDIATTLEAVAPRLAHPLSLPTGNDVAPSLDREHGDLLAALSTQLEPVAAMLRHAVGTGHPLPQAVQTAT